MTAPPHASSHPPPGILVVGLNAAWQRVLEFDQLHIGEVNRARKASECYAGKGANVARALRRIGREEAILAQFAAGTVGERILDALNAEGVRHRTVRTPGETRVCTTVLDHAGKGRVTELIDPSPTVPAAAVCELRNALREEPGLACSATALCGTWPPGADASLYCAAAEVGRRNGFVLLDAWKGITPVLEQGVDILKVNAQELRTLAGREPLHDAARHCLDAYSLVAVAVTDGAGAAYVFGRKCAYRYTLPTLAAEQVKNPIGAGDVVTAGLLHALTSAFADEGRPRASLRPTLDGIADAFGLALAWGTASCLELLPAHFDPDLAADLAVRREPV